MLLSFWTSFLVRAFAWIVLLGRNGVVNQLLIALGIIDPPANLLYNLGSVLVGMVHALMPLAVLTMLSVMENIDRNLPRAASTLGARPGTAFWQIYFPLSLPGVAAGAIMVFVTAIGFFIVPALLGGRRETMITQLIIEQVQQTLNWGFAGAISVLLLVVVLAVFALYDRLLGLSTMTGESAARAAGASAGARPRAPRRRRRPRRARRASATGCSRCSRGAGATSACPAVSRSAALVVCWSLLFLISVPALSDDPALLRQSGLELAAAAASRCSGTRTCSPRRCGRRRRCARSLVGIGAAVLAMLIGTPAAFLLVRSRCAARARCSPSCCRRSSSRA